MPFQVLWFWKYAISFLDLTKPTAASKSPVPSLVATSLPVPNPSLQHLLSLLSWTAVERMATATAAATSGLKTSHQILDKYRTIKPP